VLGCEHSKGVLAQCHVFGLGISKDRHKGLALATKSAEAGSCFGQFVVGFLAEDFWKRWDFLTKASASGSAEALYWLGRTNEEGHTFPDGSHRSKDMKMAFSYYSRAADKGHIDAMMIVADWCKLGKGTNIDIQRTLFLLQEIASGLDKYYYDVHGKILNLSSNFEEIRAIIMMMDPCKDVVYCFDKCNNQIVRLNDVALYQILADKGHGPSQVWLAEDARKKKNFSRVAEYLRLAADQGHADSMCKLADLLLHGTGVAKDQCEAARLYQVAAEKGHQQAQLNLSNVLGEGIGVAPDQQERKRWLVACAKQGNLQAKFILACIEESLLKTAKLNKKK
jgi:TPR repeat protein